jgi:hypothetical protein
MVATIFSLFATIVFLSFPVLMIWGWLRWARRKDSITLFSILSLVGFVLATTSELIAISMVIYARTIGGFAYYDHTLMRIYAVGTLLSLAGLIFAIIGVWRPGSIRWHALGCAAGTLLYWLVQLANE